MGTRNLTMVVLDKKTRVAQYCQWDGYPSGQGKRILQALTKMDLDKLRERVRDTRFISDEEVHARWKEFGADDSGMVSMAIADKFKKVYPQLHRDMGGDVLNHIYKSKKTVDLVDSSDFVRDSLFCEWAYVIDLDKNVLEVYKGFNTKPLPKRQRFAKLKPEGNKSFSGETYYPVKLAKTWSLDDLPGYEDFEKILDPEQE